jgi:hypothetical protein
MGALGDDEQRIGVGLGAFGQQIGLDRAGGFDNPTFSAARKCVTSRCRRVASTALTMRNPESPNTRLWQLSQTSSGIISTGIVLGSQYSAEYRCGP